MTPKTFVVRKTDPIDDFIVFLNSVINGPSTGVYAKRTCQTNAIVFGPDFKLYVTIGSKYIRVCDTQYQPFAISQLTYDTNLDFEKYAAKMMEVIKSAKINHNYELNAEDINKICVFLNNEKLVYKHYDHFLQIDMMIPYDIPTGDKSPEFMYFQIDLFHDMRIDIKINNMMSFNNINVFENSISCHMSDIAQKFDLIRLTTSALMQKILFLVLGDKNK